MRLSPRLNWLVVALLIGCDGAPSPTASHAHRPTVDHDAPPSVRRDAAELEPIRASGRLLSDYALHMKHWPADPFPLGRVVGRFERSPVLETLPDGAHLVSDDEAIRIMTLDDQALRPAGQFTSPRLDAVVVSADGRMALTRYTDYSGIGYEKAVRVVDLTDRAAPRVMSTIDLAADRAALSPDGAVALLVVEERLLRVDLSDPAAPIVSSDRLNEGRTFLGFSPGGHQAYRLRGDRLEVLDARTLGTIGELSLAVSGRELLVTPDGRQVLIAGDQLLMVVDVTDPARPRLHSTETTAIRLPWQREARSMRYDAARALLHLRAARRLETIDLRTPGAPRSLGTIRLPGDGRGLTLTRKGQVLVDIGQTVYRLNPRDALDRPVETWRDAGDRFTAVAVHPSGTIAFIGSYAGLIVEDISDPVAPVPIAEIDALDRVAHVALSADGSMAAVSTWNGLILFDVSDPAAPTRLAEVPVTRADVVGARFSPDATRLYVGTEGGGGLDIIDIQTPEAPVALGFVYDRHVEDIEMQHDGRHVFLVDTYERGLMVIDVTSPDAPEIVGRFLTPISRIDLSPDGRLLAAAGDGVIHLIDISDPTAPRGLSRWRQACLDLAFAPDGQSLRLIEPDGLRVVDISDRSAPMPSGFFETMGAVEHMSARPDGTVWLSQTQHRVGRQILTIDAPPTLTPLPSMAGHQQYRLRWADAHPWRAERFAWHATVGSVVMKRVDQAAQTAIVEWQRPPKAAGTLRLAVGNVNQYRAVRATR